MSRPHRVAVIDDDDDDPADGAHPAAVAPAALAGVELATSSRDSVPPLALLSSPPQPFPLMQSMDVDMAPVFVQWQPVGNEVAHRQLPFASASLMPPPGAGGMRRLVRAADADAAAPETERRYTAWSLADESTLISGRAANPPISFSVLADLLDRSQNSVKSKAKALAAAVSAAKLLAAAIPPVPASLVSGSG